MIVVDASVFAKLLIDEPDRPKAVAMIEHAVADREKLIAPSLIVYEVLSIALRRSVPFADVMTALDMLRASALSLEEPTIGDLLIAEKIATAGHAKSGYPDLGDSIYHAMAIERRGTFVTASQRHFAKAKQFGNVMLLADWRPDTTPPRP